MFKATRSLRRRAGVLGATAMAAVLAAGLSPAAAHADAAHHYYLELGGTGAAADAPGCTASYDEANKVLGDATAIPVCYPASAGPWLGSHGETPALGAPNYDDSVHQGYQNLLNAVEDAYHRDPAGRFTIVGYSQGAQAADQVLQTIAGGTDIPSGQVDGMLYSDPMQPGTGIWAMIPKGVSAFGFTSTGAGPADFGGIPVERFCIHTDGICDATTIQSVGGFFVQHGLYPQAGGIMTQTIGHDGGNGIHWYDQN